MHVRNESRLGWRTNYSAREFSVLCAARHLRLRTDEAEATEIAIAAAH
jgi:hypothetical protein